MSSISKGSDFREGQVGPYAAHTLLMLLGHYGELAIDAEMRAFMCRKYFHGKAPTDQEIRTVYERSCQINGF